jgi:hypothetical protein
VDILMMIVVVVVVVQALLQDVESQYAYAGKMCKVYTWNSRDNVTKKQRNRH